MQAESKDIWITKKSSGNQDWKHRHLCVSRFNGSSGPAVLEHSEQWTHRHNDSGSNKQNGTWGKGGANKKKAWGGREGREDRAAGSAPGTQPWLYFVPVSLKMGFISIFAQIFDDKAAFFFLSSREAFKTA